MNHDEWVESILKRNRKMDEAMAIIQDEVARGKKECGNIVVWNWWFGNDFTDLCNMARAGGNLNKWRKTTNG